MNNYRKNFLNGDWAFIFDMDGLMLDSERVSNWAWMEAGREFGYELPESALIPCLGQSLAVFEKTQRQLFGELYPFAEIWDRKVVLFNQFAERKSIPLKADLLSLLDLLESYKIRKAVASSTERSQVLKRLEMTELINHFEVIVTGSEVKQVKPAPDLFLETAHQLQIAPSFCVVLEDSPHGVEAAIVAGMYVFLVPDIIPIPKELESQVIGIYPTLEEVSREIISMNIRDES